MCENGENNNAPVHQYHQDNGNRQVEGFSEFKPIFGLFWSSSKHLQPDNCLLSTSFPPRSNVSSCGESYFQGCFADNQASRQKIAKQQIFEGIFSLG
jgi:hypothetical protein